MKKRETVFYKKEPHVQVYQYVDNPDSVFKKYLVDYNLYNSKYDLELIRKKLIDIKNCNYWPEFVIKPKNVSQLNKNSFVTEFPFVDGVRFDSFLKTHDMSFATCANFIKNLEEKLLSKKDFVFPDVANNNNIMITSCENNDLQFVIIDPDDIQFSDYRFRLISGLIAPCLSKPGVTKGLKKCFDSNAFLNKQMDIRSIYALFYCILNGYDNFYPVLFEKEISEYIDLLKSYNIPNGCKLYKQSLATLDDNKQNKPISSALFELIDDGYEFEIYGKNVYGNQYRLVKKK